MATINPEPVQTFEIRVDQLEITRGPTINHPGDRERRFVSGPRHYYINGHEVSEQRYESAIKSAGVSFND